MKPLTKMSDDELLDEYWRRKFDAAAAFEDRTLYYRSVSVTEETRRNNALDAAATEVRRRGLWEKVKT